MKFPFVRAMIAPLAALAVFSTGCNQNNSQSGAPAPSTPAAGTAAARPVVGVIPKGSTHAFWKAVHAGANAAAQEFGCDIRWNATDLETDRERQIQILEDDISEKVDGIVIAPVDRDALAPSINKAAAANIPVSIIDSAASTTNYLTFAATDNYQGGVMAARRMGQILGGKGNVIVIKYAPGSASTTDRENGFIETMQKEFPGVTIVDAKYGMATVESAMQAAEDLLTRHPDLQGLFACNVSTAVGSFRALQSQRRPEVKMVGFDAEKSLVDAVRAGTIDSIIVQNPFQMGYEGVKAIMLHLKGQAVPRRIDTGVHLVTVDALADPAIQKIISSQ